MLFGGACSGREHVRDVAKSKKKKKKVAESKNGKATRQCSDRGEVRLRCTRYDVDQVTRWDTLLMTMLYDWHSKDSDMMHDDVWW